MADPVVHLTNGIPDLGTGNITTLGQIIDPTNGPVAVKAASTAPVATDKALVVAISPNSVNPNGQAAPLLSAPVVNAASGYSAAVTLTRTADAIAYVAGQVVGASKGASAALTFTGMGPSGQDIMITSVSLEIDAAAVISGETSYRLYLYNVTPPSALVDGATWDLPSGDRASFLGYVDLGTPVDLGSTLYVKTDTVNAQVKLLGVNLFGYLVTNGGYTPTSARVHIATLHSVAL